MTVDISYDIEHENRGFIVDIIELYDGDSEIGYIKLGYVDPIFYKKHKTDAIIYYVDEIKGWCGIWDSYKNGDLESFSKTIYNRISWNYDFGEDPDWNYYSKESIKLLQQKFKNDYKKFQDYFFNKYYVDYARINDRYKGRGYYIKLYEQALKLANSRNFPLYTSSLKSNEAEFRFSNHLKTNSIIVESEKYTYGNGGVRNRVIKVNYRK